MDPEMRAGLTSPTPASGQRNQRILEFMGSMVLGIAVGVVVSFLAAYVLWYFRYIEIGPISCPDAKTLCEPTADLELLCLTCPAREVTVIVTPTFTPTATPTLDVAAAATAACADFSAQFPGTPCPPLQATATPSP